MNDKWGGPKKNERLAFNFFRTSPLKGRFSWIFHKLNLGPMFLFGAFND